MSLNHLAIIMDGNRRWAKERGLPSIEGHRLGYAKLKEVGEWCIARGIKVFSVFAFSTENWKRAEEEVGYLMRLLEQAFTQDLPFFEEHGIRIRIVGRREGLSEHLLKIIETAEARTAQNGKLTFCICFNYGGRAEIVDAMKRLIEAGTSASEITEEKIQSAMYWPEMPDPDLILRTSGEERLSGFLLWQSAYSELLWVKKYWPDFSEEDLDAALNEYESRQRRFGK